MAKCQTTWLNIRENTLFQAHMKQFMKVDHILRHEENINKFLKEELQTFSLITTH